MPSESLTLFCFRDTSQIAVSKMALFRGSSVCDGCRPGEGAVHGSRGNRRDRAWPSLDGVCLPALIVVTRARDDRESLQTLRSRVDFPRKGAAGIRWNWTNFAHVQPVLFCH